jgi:hypothetical protein
VKYVGTAKTQPWGDASISDEIVCGKLRDMPLPAPGDTGTGTI